MCFCFCVRVHVRARIKMYKHHKRYFFVPWQTIAAVRTPFFSFIIEYPWLKTFSMSPNVCCVNPFSKVLHVCVNLNAVVFFSLLSILRYKCECELWMWMCVFENDNYDRALCLLSIFGVCYCSCWFYVFAMFLCAHCECHSTSIRRAINYLLRNSEQKLAPWEIRR